MRDTMGTDRSESDTLLAEPRAGKSESPLAALPGAADNDVAPAAASPLAAIWARRQSIIASIALAGIALHLLLRFVLHAGPGVFNMPLWGVLILGGTPLVIELSIGLFHGQFGSDLLAGISICTSALLGEYLAGALVVLMLSGGQTLEAYAVGSASSVLRALAKRLPSIAHLKRGLELIDVATSKIVIGDRISVFPHEICPVDGVVVDGHSVMDESYLTGEPFMMSKTPGSEVMSGSINGDGALVIAATRLAIDSRYAKIMQVMHDSEQRSPMLRRLGDQLGAWFTPFAVLIAVAAWVITGQSHRFLAVLVVATPCPLLIAIPVAIIGSISLAARRGIIIKKPVVLEQSNTCRTIIFDKTGTLTYGEPRLAEVVVAAGQDRDNVLQKAASLERYSKHPLARAVMQAAEEAKLPVIDAERVGETAGEGLGGMIDGTAIRIISRKEFLAEKPAAEAELPPVVGGLECVVVIGNAYAATLRFRDEPRADGLDFISHLNPKHSFRKMMLVSGDRLSEVKYLADNVGIKEVHAGKSPEEKLEIVRHETSLAKTIYLGDGINDAPALTAATVGLALGQKSDITSEAAGAVILDTSLKKVDEFFHISARMRQIALQSALGGMILSAVGMLLASAGYLSPVAGAVCQEAIDVLAVLNALRAAFPPRTLSDF